MTPFWWFLYAIMPLVALISMTIAAILVLLAEALKLRRKRLSFRKIAK